MGWLLLCVLTLIPSLLLFQGIVVNSELQAATDLWVAGDSACFYSDTLGRCGESHTRLLPFCLGAGQMVKITACSLLALLQTTC